MKKERELILDEIEDAQEAYLEALHEQMTVYIEKTREELKKAKQKLIDFDKAVRS